METKPAILTAKDLESGRFITLAQGSRLTTVPYDTLISAHYAQRLCVWRHIDDSDATLLVNIYDFCVYMINEAPEKYRWSQQSIPVAEILPVGVQPRLKAHSKKTITTIADHLRRGGQTPPVWVMKNPADLQLVLLDGHRRRLAHTQAGRELIAAITIPIGFIYAMPIAFEANLRHGKTLEDQDQRQRVKNFLREHPEYLEKLNDGRISQSQLSLATGASDATVSRALGELLAKTGKAPAQIRTVLGGLRAMFKHLDHETPDDADTLALIVAAVSRKLVQQIPKDRRADIHRRIKLNASAVCRDLSPEIHALYDARGGDRRRPSITTN